MQQPNASLEKLCRLVRMPLIGDLLIASEKDPLEVGFVEPSIPIRAHTVQENNQLGL